MLKTPILAALVGSVALASAQSTTLLSSTFENGTNGPTTIGKAFTGGTVSSVWSGTAANASFGGSNAQHNGPGSLSSLINRTTTTGYGYWWGDLNGGQSLPYAAGQTIEGSADFFLPASGTNSLNGATFGLQAYADGGNDFLGGVALYGGLTLGNLVYAESIDANGFVQYTQTYDSAGSLVTYAKGAWNTLSIKLTYSQESVTVGYFLNGSALYRKDATTLVPFGLTFSASAGPIGLSDIDVTTDYVTASRGTAYVDNYAVVSTTKAVPEPLSFFVLGSGVVAMLRRRR